MTDFASATYAPGAPSSCGRHIVEGEDPPKDSCVEFQRKSRRECWHSDGCPYTRAFDPDPGEDFHDPDKLASLIEFARFCVESMEQPDPSAPPPRQGQKQAMITRWNLSLEKFRLACEVFGVEEASSKKAALECAGIFASACDKSRDVALARQRKIAASRDKVRK